MRKSLKYQIAMLCAMIALFMAVGLGVVVNHLSSQALQRSYRDSIIQNTRNISSLVEVHIDSQISLLESIARRPALMSQELSDKEKIETLKEDASSAKQNGVLRYGIANSKGITQMTNNASSNVSTRDYFIASLNGKNFVTSPMMAKSDQAWIIICSTPIHDENGKISSVLFVVMEGNFFTKVLATQTTDYETNTWFVDTDGNTIGDADFQNVINGENILTSAETDKGYMALSEIYKDAFQGKTDAKTYTYSNNEKYYCGYTPVKGYPWFLFFEISYMKLQKGLRL